MPEPRILVCHPSAARPDILDALARTGQWERDGEVIFRDDWPVGEFTVYPAHMRAEAAQGPWLGEPRDDAPAPRRGKAT